MELYKQLANFFTGVRLKKCGQPQKHFSKLIALPPHRIPGLENSTIKPTIDDVDVYAKYLGVTVGDVFRAAERRNVTKILNGEWYDPPRLVQRPD